jgi:glycosyltransferase involved in cell wall biosynthesis
MAGEREPAATEPEAHMKLVALMPVRNEDWVLGLSARVALMWCDHLVILDHASTDRTQEILRDLCAEHPGRLTCLRNSEGLWDEMAHRQTMLEAARAENATHIAIVDADEILTANLVPGVRLTVETSGAARSWSFPATTSAAR